MGMGIGINDAAPDEGVLKGKQEPVACSVWFTATGRMIPKLLKYKEQNGEIITIYNVHVVTSAKKNYCGIPTRDFDCEAVIGGILKKFRLNFNAESDIPWKMVWR